MIEDLKIFGRAQMSHHHGHPESSRTSTVEVANEREYPLTVSFRPDSGRWKCAMMGRNRRTHKRLPRLASRSP